jgi:hypothetical protein
MSFAIVTWIRHDESEAKSSLRVAGEARVAAPRYCAAEADRQLLDLLNQLGTLGYRLATSTHEQHAAQRVTTLYLQHESNGA